MRRLAPWSLALLAILGGACAERGGLVVRQGGPLQPLSAAALPVTGTASSVLSPAPGAASKTRLVEVRSGESLWSLSRRWLGTGFRWPEIASANHLARPWTLTPGQRVGIPPLKAAAVASAAPRPVDEAARYGWQPRRGAAYTVGEKLTFAVQYGGLTAGYATLSIPDLVTRDGRSAFHIVAEARSLPFFDAFFRVHDVLDSYIDADYDFSWGYEKHLQEGGFRADAVYDYDQRRGLILEPAKGKQAPLPPLSQDVLSCFYYFRDQPLSVGSVVTIPVTDDNMKSYQLVVNVLRKERVSTLAGDFDCLVVQPHLAFKGVFRQRGDVYIWITDDRRRLPVLIRSKIVIGSININLQNAQWVEAARKEAGGQEARKGP